MSDDALAIIWIGGRLDAAGADVLIEAINQTQVYSKNGDVFVEPRAVEDLLDLRDEQGHLYLCDDAAPYGEMPGITAACHQLGLSYRLWAEASGDNGSEVTIWAPGMERPLSFTGEHMNPEAILVDSRVVIEALDALRTGNIEEALRLLEGAVPKVQEVPPFTLDDRVAGADHDAASMTQAAGQ